MPQQNAQQTRQVLALQRQVRALQGQVRALQKPPEPQEAPKAWSTWGDDNDWQEQWPNADDEWPDDDDSQRDNGPSWNEWQSGSQAWQDDQSWGLWQDRGQSSGSRTSDSGDLTSKIHMVSFGDFEIGETP